MPTHESGIAGELFAAGPANVPFRYGSFVMARLTVPAVPALTLHTNHSRIPNNVSVLRRLPCMWYAHVYLQQMSYHRMHQPQTGITLYLPEPKSSTMPPCMILFTALIHVVLRRAPASSFLGPSYRIRFIYSVHKHLRTSYSIDKMAKKCQGVYRICVTHTTPKIHIHSHIPKPVLKRLGNPRRIKFTMHDEYITVDRPDE